MKSIFILFITFIFWACNFKSEQQSDKIQYTVSNDSSISYVENLANLLSLNNIKESKNNFDLRVWFCDHDNNFVLSIAEENKDTLASIKQYQFIEGNNQNYIQIIKDVKSLTPLCGWSALGDSLNKITSDSIFISDTREKIKGFTGGIFLNFQFQGKGKYKEANIFSPAYMQEKKSKQFLNFIRFLEQQFQTKIYFE